MIIFKQILCVPIIIYWLFLLVFLSIFLEFNSILIPTLIQTSGKGDGCITRNGIRSTHISSQTLTRGPLFIDAGDKNTSSRRLDKSGAIPLILIY